MCTVQSNATAVRRPTADCGPRAFAMLGLWRVLSGLFLAVVALDHPVSQAADLTVTIRPDAHHQTILGWSGMPWYPNVSAQVRDDVLDVNLPPDSVLTVYPHPGKNLAPTVVEWKAEPSFLKTPASRVRLSAAAQDPELDRLSYSWSVTGQPPGVKATLADPQSATTEASGLTLPGRYVFTVAIRDGATEVKRDVRLNVYAGNQPPVLIKRQYLRHVNGRADAIPFSYSRSPIGNVH